VEGNKSSGIVVPAEHALRLYTMHGQVDIFLPNEAGGSLVTPARKFSAGTNDIPPTTPVVRP
jgi:hypothetical protein